ncbi:MAG: DUF6056 family protein [Clostridiales bacterium]|nr:DUF6056 family protein [Clostridiales bacterium]
MEHNSNTHRLNQRNREILTAYIPYFVLFAIIIFTIARLNYLFPYTCDDMTYASADLPGLFSKIKTALMQGSGRFFGNLFGYMISYRFFTVLEKTLIWGGIIFLVMKLAGSKSFLVNAAIAVILIYPCDSIFAQVYAWNAGFQNYTVPVFIILFDVYLFTAIEKTKNRHLKRLLILLLTASSFAGQFFSENSSFFALCLGICILILAVKYRKSSVFPAAVYTAGTALGFAAMFLYPHFLGTSSKIENYRSYAESISGLLSQAVKNYRLIAADFAQYFFLWAVLSAAYLILINKFLIKKHTGGIVKAALTFSRVIIAAYPVFSLIYSLVFKSAIEFPRTYLRYFLCISLGLYATTLTFASVLVLINKDIEIHGKATPILFFLSAVSILPLLAVSPIGARTFYITYVCLLLAGIITVGKYIPKININKGMLQAVCITALCCVSFALVMAEKDNSYASSVRLSYLKSEIESGSESVTLPLLPHGNLAHDDSNEGAWNSYIEKNYGTSISYNFIEWNSWYNEYYRNSQ